MSAVKKYLKPGYYGRSLPISLVRKIKAKTGKLKGGLAVKKIFDEVNEVFEINKKYYLSTKNIRLSRFVPVSLIIKKRIHTCASVAALAAAVLRQLGYPTRLIDGKIDNQYGRFRHAWLEVYLPEKKKFIPFDPIARGYKISAKHYRRKAYLDWRELEKEEF